MGKIKPGELLETHDNGRQKCSVCDDTIPAETPRISFQYQGSYGGSNYKRVCAECIIKLGNHLRLKHED